MTDAAADRAGDAPLPALVVGGYLGAGKTTLVNRLLRGAGGRRIAVLVNDFGEIAIDADLIESRDGDVLELAGGCVCCSVGSDLVGALMALPGRSPRPDLVLIETSGVGLPAAVARSARLARGIEVEGIVVLADAETVRARAADRWVGDVVLAQLRDADLLVLNKVDLVAPGALAGLHGWLGELAPGVPVVDAVEADLPPDLLLGPPEASPARPARLARRDAPPPGPTSPRDGRLRPPPAAAERFETATLELRGPVALDALVRALADPAAGVLRAKGWVRDADGVERLVQAVGARVRTTPGAAPRGAASGRLVVVARRGTLDAAALARAIAG
ncbi:MAG TPA: CobW family GTP-binding protein [Burkholderiaceae bacterium]|nr:CobW family GTP-binding protein [Burkholderiaceae bacterium]